MHRRGRSWVVRIYRDGKERRINLGHDYDEARRQFDEIKSGALPAVKLTVSAAAREWLELYVKLNRKPKGYKDALRRIERYLDPGLGHKLVTRLRSRDCWQYRRWVEGHEIKPATVAYILGDLRSLLLWCEGNYIDRSPVPRRFLPRLDVVPPKRLQPDEEARARALPGKLGYVCRLALATGMRWSELCRAQASDIETIAEADGTRSMVILVRQSKSGRSRRVPLPPAMAEELRSRIGRLVAYAPSSLSSVSRDVAKRAEIPGFHFHQLRHTYACSFLELGGSLEVLQELLGHASITTTQVYARVSDSVTRREYYRVITGQKPATENATHGTDGS